MCGIAGWLSWSKAPGDTVVKALTDALVHRGPDAGGVIVRGPVALGHRRLSIIDVGPASNQPMADWSGQYWIVYNGELYNFRELRKELQRHGSRFATAGDTEVILEAYKHWDLDCLARFNGMFAFALWDEPRQRLLLARDRLGEKPLFYCALPDDSLVFASEIQALRQHPAIKGGVDPVALGQYLSLGYTTGEATLLAGVRRLPAASFMLAERERPLVLRHYWDLASHFRNKAQCRSEGEAAEALQGLIDDAVRLRLVSDVPLGAFLSGGIDSSTTVAAMARLGPPEQVKTFSIGFNETSFDEVKEARAAARFLSVDHHDRVLVPDPATLIRSLTCAAGEPLADSSFLPTYCLAAFARETVTVALSGDGGDECFAGYETYIADRLHRLLAWLPAWAGQGVCRAVDLFLPVSFAKVSFDYKLRHFLSGLPLDGARAHFSWRTIFTDAERAAIVLPEWRQAVAAVDAFEVFKPHFEAVAGCHYLDQAMYVDIKTWLTDDILVKVDRATMAHSLEARPPFLDHRVVEFAASLPVSWKLKGARKKHILKESQKKRLPDWVITRRKQGFNAPVSHWFAGSLRQFAGDVLAERAIDDWFDRQQINLLWDQHCKRQRDNGLKLLGLVCFALWLRQA